MAAEEGRLLGGLHRDAAGVGSDGVFWDDQVGGTVDVVECRDHKHILVAEHST